MRKIQILIMAFVATTQVFAQKHLTEVLAAIEQNNVSLKAMRENVKAEQLENKTDIFLSDPELGFNYLWGSPSPIDNRTDVSITQSLDIATLTGKKTQVANQKNKMLEWQYQAERMRVMLEAKQYVLDLIYYNRLLQEMETRKQYATSIATIQKQRLDKGEGNILEYNNVCMGQTKIEAEIQRLETERTSILSQLSTLNGGDPVVMADTEYPAIVLPADFDTWYVSVEGKNPMLGYVKSSIELSKKQLALNKSLGLPSFSIGYMSEKTMGEHYQGVSVGVSIPLWSNKNKVRQAKAAVSAAMARKEEATSLFYGQIKDSYQRALGLQEAARMYQRSFTAANNSQLLKKALDAGEISVLDYLVQMELYYDSMDKALSMERDFQKACAELSAYAL